MNPQNYLPRSQYALVGPSHEKRNATHGLIKLAIISIDIFQIKYLLFRECMIHVHAYRIHPDYEYLLEIDKIH